LIAILNKMESRLHTCVVGKLSEKENQVPVHAKRGVGEEMNSVSVLQSETRLVDVTGIEPVPPCLQSTRLDSIRSLDYFQLLTFPTNRGTCFSLEAIPNDINKSDSCALRVQPQVGSEDPQLIVRHNAAFVRHDG
jgi:hypothetical protein